MALYGYRPEFWIYSFGIHYAPWNFCHFFRNTDFHLWDFKLADFQRAFSPFSEVSPDLQKRDPQELVTGALNHQMEPSTSQAEFS